MSNVDVTIQPTPNPNALKFILNEMVKNNGKSTYRCIEDCEHVPMAVELFKLRGVDQVHFYQNVLTLSKFNYAEWDELEKNVIKTLEDNLEKHNPDYKDPNPEEERRANLTPELQKIEEILDRTIRPGLQGDGGDVECVTYEDHVLVIRYQGACGTCPSSTQGTLYAITGILRDEFDPEIEVYPAPAY